MSINEIINTDSNVMLVISAADLKEFVLELLDERKGSSKLTPERFLTITETVEKYGIRLRMRAMSHDKSILMAVRTDDFPAPLRPAITFRYDKSITSTIVFLSFFDHY